MDAENGILYKEGNRKLVLGRDFDLVWYDGQERAANGDGFACWRYLENETDKMMHPGKMYMMYFGSQFKTVRFEKHAGAPIVYTGDPNAVTDVSTYSLGTGNTTDANWNGIANPSVCHAFLNAGTSYGQVLGNGNLDDYFANPANPIYNTVSLSSYKFVVGKPVFIQAAENKPVVVNPFISGALSAPKRAQALDLPKGIDAMYEVHIALEGHATTDNLFVQITEEDKADTYVIGQDLAKGGVTKTIPQLWINRYNAKLSVNTQALTNDVAEFPLTIFAPDAGEYTINTDNAYSDYDLYLTFNGEAIWNLSNGKYTFSLPQGNTTTYGLRVSAHASQVTTGIGNVQGEDAPCTKVLRDGVIYILRGNNTYSIDGQLIK